MNSLKFLNFNTTIKLCNERSALLQLIRRGGMFKRSPALKLRASALQDLYTNFFDNRTELSVEEWQEAKQALINNNKYISSNNVDAMMIGLFKYGHQLPLAKDYLKYLKQINVEPNVATLGRLLRVYNTAYHERGGSIDSLTTEEQNEILSIYTHFRSKHDVFDITTCENLIHGLVATERFGDCKELIEMTKLTAVPTVAAYSEVAVKAFSTNDMSYGWQILDEMVTAGKQPKCEVFIAYIEQITKNLDKSFQHEFEKLLEFFGQHDIIISEKVVDYIASLEKKNLLSSTESKLSRSGKCRNCNNQMENISVSAADFSKLSNSFLNKVLIRNDVFQKSTPQEVDRFKAYVAETAPYDCVIDGLNVAYSMGMKKSPAMLANLVTNVVKYFSKQNKHVLVLGRQHMQNWSKTSWNYIYKNASVFLTNNLTHDDPFLLYATLKSGHHTDFFSRDLMRTHSFLLGPELRPIFRRWQQEHQYSLVTQTEGGKIIVKEPIRFMICAHKVKDTWHLPYKQEYLANPPTTFEVSSNWLCIKFQNQPNKVTEM